MCWSKQFMRRDTQEIKRKNWGLYAFSFRLLQHYHLARTTQKTWLIKCKESCGTDSMKPQLRSHFLFD